MKTVFFIAIVFLAASANAQSLKDILYSGKLKSDTGTVVRKTDDLSAKIDTTTRKSQPPEPEKTRVVTVTRDSAGIPVTTTTTVTAEDTSATGAPVVKDNTRLWKDFMDELQGTLRTDVLPSKKIKGGTYSVLIDYAIDVDGQVVVSNVSSSPENTYLQDQIRERITLSAPKMTPLLGTNGKPRKAAKKQTITVTK